MKKILFITLIFVLFNQISYAAQIGVIEYQKVVDNYALAQRYKKELDIKYKSINKYIEQQEKNIKNAKDNQTKASIQKKGIVEVEKRQKEYVALKQKREQEVIKKINVVAEKIRIQKKLDVILKKEVLVTGGIDCTQEVINGLK